MLQKLKGQHFSGKGDFETLSARLLSRKEEEGRKKEKPFKIILPEAVDV